MRFTPGRVSDLPSIAPVGVGAPDVQRAVAVGREHDVPVPPIARRALAMCLEKDPRKRLRDIGDVWLLVEEPAPAASTPPPRAWAGWRAWALAGTFAFLWQRARVPSPHAVEFELSAPEGTEFSAPGPRGTAVSPDGRAIVFVAQTGPDASLWVRRLDSKTARMLPGTTGAVCPFWSPDSRSVAFVQDGKLRSSAIAFASGCRMSASSATFGSKTTETGAASAGIVIDVSRPVTSASTTCGTAPAVGTTPTPI